MAPAFDAQIKHWPSITAFDAYLQGVPRPSWCLGITNHNSYIPNELTWAGVASLQSMLAYYRDTKKWRAGPHLFLAATAPNVRDVGIFQLTPLAHVGIHAGDCNDTHLGIEWVGDFDARPPNADQYTLGIAVNLLILQRWGIPPEAVNAHNECMAGRTCPGKYLTGTQIRASLREPPPPLTKRYRVKSRYVTQRKEDNGPPHVRELVSGEVVVVDKWYPNNRVHLADGSGFADLVDLEAL